MKLRPYQEQALAKIRKHYGARRKRVLLHLATGGGKTLIFCQVMKGAAEKKKKVLLAVRGRELVAQASERLTREGVDHGVYMAGHWKYDPNNPVQVCSIDTLRSRNARPEADLIVVDEAHMATSRSYMDFLADYRDKFILAVTATPYVKQGLRHLADVVVKPVSVQQLIDDGYLVPPRYFAPSKPNLDDVRIRAGEYVEEDLFRSMSKLVGDVVEHWKGLGQGRPTVCFAVNIQHSLNIVASFNAAGIRAVHVEAETKDEDRKNIMRELEAGRIKVVSNVGILCTGVDMPYVGTIIMARPTKSYTLYIQQAGRGTRPSANKSDFILLDHAANVRTHGFIVDEREATLDPVPKGSKKSTGVPAVTTCKECYAIYASSCVACPDCGAVNPARAIKTKGGTLEEIAANDQDIKVRSFIAAKKDVARRKGYKRGWIYHELKREFGEAIAEKYMPPRNVPDWVLQKLTRS
jgi:superfamily II DNA or RNA helicase